MDESNLNYVVSAKRSNPLKTILITGILIVVSIWLFGKVQDVFRPKSWTLFIYKSESPDLDAQKARIDTYKSQAICIEKGISFTNKGGSFECGYDCKFKNDYLTEVCDKVCGSNGCRD